MARSVKHVGQDGILRLDGVRPVQVFISCGSAKHDANASAKRHADGSAKHDANASAKRRAFGSAKRHAFGSAKRHVDTRSLARRKADCQSAAGCHPAPHWSRACA